MARDIAHGEIVIGVDLDRVGAELRHTEAQFQRSMANIDRMKAEAKATVKTTELERKIVEAKRELLEFERSNPTASANLDSKRFDAEYAKLKAKVKDLNQEKIELNVETKGLRDSNRMAKQSEQAQSAMAREWLRSRREAEAAQKMWRDGAAIQQRGIDMDRKRSIEIEKLRLQYIKLHDEIEKGQKLAMFDFLGDETARRKFARTSAELNKVGAQLRELGDSDDDLRRLAAASDNSGNRLRRMVSSLASVRIQMGFMSATLRQTAIGFTALGPVIFGLLGQIVSLVGVLGTGLTGALAVTSAGLAGFGLTALGIGLIMKPLIGDLSDAMKASTAYGDAVRKYGKDSSQAQSAQEKLNKTLGDVGPQTRKAFESLGSLSGRWSKLTASSRPVFFDAMASGITALNKLMPMFARESNKAFSTAGRDAQKWFDMLSSKEASSGIQQIMSNFTRAFPALSSGFRSLTAMMGRVSVSASKLLPELTSGFKDWAESLMDSIGSGDTLDAKIERIVDHMRQIGRFAQSAGSMLATFFNAGANEGANLLNTLTNIFDRWNAWMQTARGQAGLAQFFSQANAIGSQFVGTLAQIGIALFEFSQAFAPLSQGAIMVVSAISSVTAALMGLEGARAVVTGIGAALATAFVVGKVVAFASALQGVFTALTTVIGLARAGSFAALFATPLGPAIALASAAVGVAAALSQITGSAAASTLDSVRAAADGARAALDALSNADTAAASARMAQQSATAAATAAERAYNDAVKQHGKKSAEAKAASTALSEARMRESEATQRATTADKDAVKAQQEVVDKQRELHKEKEKALGDGMSEMSLFDHYKRGLNDITDALGMTDHAGKRAAETSQKLAELRKAEREAAEGLARSELNLARRNAGIGAQADVIQKVGNAWQRVRDVIPTGARKAIIQATDPKDAARAIQLADKLNSMGKGAAAGRILVNTKNIDAALVKLKQLTKTSTTLVEAKVNKGKAEREIQNLGKGKTATINAKADTKQAKREMSQLTGKQLVNRISIRANNSQALSALNAVERKKLKTKLLNMGANPSAVMAAINKINGTKIPEKLAKFKAETSQAEAGNKKVQAFKDKPVKLISSFNSAGTDAAKAAIASVPSNKTSTITTVHRTVGSPGGRAAGGPTAGAYSYDPLPAQEKRHAQSAERAGTRQSQPGVYRRPTLLVGEENRREWVIAENPSYRGANERYLEDAAANFGYQLMPFDENAATGKSAKKAIKPKVFNKLTKPQKPKNVPTAENLAKNRTRYDWLRDQISSFETAGSNERTRQDNAITAGTMSEYNKNALMAPYERALGLYPDLRKTMQSMLTSMRGNLSKQMGIDRGISKGDLKKLQNRVKSLKQSVPREKRNKDGKVTNAKAIRLHEREIKKAEKQLDDAKERDRNARGRIPSIKDEIANLKRELMLDVPNEEDALKNTIESIRVGDNGAGAGGGSTPYGIQLGALDKARYDIWSQFAGNVLPGGSGISGLPGGPVGGSSTPPGGPSFYGSSAAAGTIPGGSGGSSPAGAGAAVQSGGGGTTVNQTINMQKPPPDPHSFSKQLGWEAASMLG